MAKYLFQANYNANGIAGLRNEGGSSRQAMFTNMFNGLGGSIESFYYTFGSDDLIMIVDLPDDAAAVAASLAASAAGAINFRSTVLITPETIDEAVKRDVDYTPPKS